MASTNKTTNYELSQYVGSDKPTYLTDYNQDMSKIDAGIHAAKSEADTNASSIGTLSSLTTEAKTNLVAAINEVEGEVTTNTNNIATNTSNIATNTTHIGTVANLTTTAKTDLVVAANEINAKVGNLSSLNTSAKSSTVAAINEIVNKFNLTEFKEYTTSSSSSDQDVSSGITITNESLTVARNSDGSVFKMYGYLTINRNQSSSANVGVVLKNTGLTPSSEFTVKTAGTIMYKKYNGDYDTANDHFFDANFVVKANGNIEVKVSIPEGDNTVSLFFFPCLYFAKSFGDTPSA